MQKKYKLVMLSSFEKTNLYIVDGELHYSITTFKTLDKIRKTQHLYILSDEEIKENWKGIAYKHDVQVGIFNHFYTENKWYKNAKKVIASTNTSLNLPLIPKSFIDYFIKEWNKGNKIDEIELEH